MPPPAATPDQPAAPAAKERPLDALEATIRARAAAVDSGEAPGSSWTAKLLAGDLQLVGGKVIEEASELVEAAAETETAGLDPDEAAAARQHLIAEAGDLVYHTLVLLRREGVDLADVEAELAKRFGVSGIEEKESRRS
ncbi:MAG: phosphoribosyl-ATP diphosphatase [Planctomycetota bacterium]